VTPRSISVAVWRRVSALAVIVMLVAPVTGSSAAARATGVPVSRRPTAGSSDPREHGYSVPSLHLCSAHVCVHWVPSTSDAPPAFDANHNLLPDQVERTIAAFESAWRTEVVQMGFRAPRSDETSVDHGPNAELDVYLADIGADGLGGFVATDDPHASDGDYRYRDYSAYVVIDNDFSAAQFRSGGEGGLRVTAAHEFFHAVQYAYDAGEDDWLMEGTAVWMEDRVADDVNANRSWLVHGPMTRPWVPVDSSRGLHEYASWIFWRNLTESTGVDGADPTLIRRVWELAADGPGDPNLFSARAVARALEGRDRSLAGALAGFGIANLAPAVFYREGAAYPTAPVVRDHRVSARHPNTGRGLVLVNHLSTAAVAFEPGTGAPATASLRLEVDAPPRRTGSAARVLIVMRSGALRVEYLTLDADGDAGLLVPFGSKAVGRVVIVFANASTSFRCWTGAGFSCNGRSRADGMPFGYTAELVRSSPSSSSALGGNGNAIGS
jgi:hypothetical protein